MQESGAMKGLECDSLGGGTVESRQDASREGETYNRTAMTVNPLFLLLLGLHILFIWNILSPKSMCPFEVLLQCSLTNEASSVHLVSQSRYSPPSTISRVIGATRKGFHSFHSLINLGQYLTEQTFQYHILIGQNK